MSYKAIVFFTICLVFVYVIYTKFSYGEVNDSPILDFVKLRTERAADWFKEKRINEVASYDMSVLTRQIFIKKGFNMPKYSNYLGSSDLKSILPHFKDKRGLYLNDEIMIDEDGIAELKQYIVAGGHIYFEHFPFLYFIDDDKADSVEYFLKQIQDGKIAIVCIQPFTKEIENKSLESIFETYLPLSTNKNPDLFSRKMKEVLWLKKNQHQH